MHRASTSGYIHSYSTLPIYERVWLRHKSGCAHAQLTEMEGWKYGSLEGQQNRRMEGWKSAWNGRMGWPFSATVDNDQQYMNYNASIKFAILFFTCKDSRSLVLWLLRYASSKEDDEEYGTNMEIIFSDIMYILHYNTTNYGYFSHILHLDIIKLKVKMNQILIHSFKWGQTIAIPIYTLLPYTRMTVYENDKQATQMQSFILEC